MVISPNRGLVSGRSMISRSSVSNMSDTISVSSNKTPESGTTGNSEVSLALAQNLWGRGNLTPLDTQFGSMAIIKLVPTAGFGFIGYHLGHRLQKYADDMALAVDAAEVEPALTRLYKKHKSSINTRVWTRDLSLSKANRHHSFIIFLPSTLCTPLEDLYGTCATSLKMGGKLFVADIMETKPGVTKESNVKFMGCPDKLALGCFDNHIQALKSAGIEVECDYDLTENVLAAIRSGLSQSLEMLENLRVSQDVQRLPKMIAFAEQLEIWRKLYSWTEAANIKATGLLGVRRK